MFIQLLNLPIDYISNRRTSGKGTDPCTGDVH